MESQNGEKLFQKYLKKSSHVKPEILSYLATLDHLRDQHPSIAQAIFQELKDQRTCLKLIASENYSSLSVQLAMGNLLTDKYAEGYVDHRFYAGCGNIDLVENEAQESLKTLFGAEHAYVQPHSGADANLLAFWAILVKCVQDRYVEVLGKKKLEELSPQEYEDIRKVMMNQKVMGLSLNSGGHLTHGFRHNLSSKMMRAVSYDVNPETEKIDYSSLEKSVKQEKPLILLTGYSAYSRRLNFARLREIADSVGAVLMVDMAHFSGLVAGKVFTNEEDPVPYADIVTSTTHKTLRGPRGGIVLCKKEFKDYINKGCPLVLGGPLPHVMAAKAIAFKEAQEEDFKKYAQQVVENARVLAESFQSQGLRVVSGGTDNHMLVLDLRSLGLTGKQAEIALRQAHITLNRNTIPFDTMNPWYTSGIRLGTPALTTLGMGKEHMQKVAAFIVKVLKNTKAKVSKKTNKPSLGLACVEAKTLQSVQNEVKELLGEFKLYPEVDIDCF